MGKLLIPLLTSLALPTAVNANTHVNDSLNAADMNFNVGNKDMACTMVSMAILAANSPEIYMLRLQVVLKEKSKITLINVI